ncbi:MAG TPA: DUF1810 domain-containing protein [Acidimicrobiales bacterium]|nr:DUF1810 domain-containing protein [Acidimicrobiales bacterium]
MDGPFDLERFVEAQRPIYDRAVAELRDGYKQSHWMWFIFPQLAGLGRSDLARYYALSSAAEARAFFEHPVLGPRLRECTAALLACSVPSAAEIMGDVDALKLRSSMTLFLRVAPEETSFAEVLQRFYSAMPDPATDELLRPGVL